MPWMEPRNRGTGDDMLASGAPYRMIYTILPSIHSHTYDLESRLTLNSLIHGFDMTGTFGFNSIRVRLWTPTLMVTGPTDKWGLKTENLRVGLGCRAAGDRWKQNKGEPIQPSTQLQSPLDWMSRPPVCRSSDTTTTLITDMCPWVLCWPGNTPWYRLELSNAPVCPRRHLAFAPPSEPPRSSALERPKFVGWTQRQMSLVQNPAEDVAAAKKHVLISVLKRGTRLIAISAVHLVPSSAPPSLLKTNAVKFEV